MSKLVTPIVLLALLTLVGPAHAERRGYAPDGPSRLDPSMRWSDIDRAGPGRGPWISPRTDGRPVIGGPIYIEPRVPSSSQRRY